MMTGLFKTSIRIGGLARPSYDSAVRATIAIGPWLRCAVSRSRCRGLAQRGDDSVDDLLDHDAVLALSHHANDGLGARRSDQQPAMSIEPLLAGADRRLD